MMQSLFNQLPVYGVKTLGSTILIAYLLFLFGLIILKVVLLRTDGTNFSLGQEKNCFL